MKFFVIVERRSAFKPEDFAPHLAAETRRATELYAEGCFREIYSRADGRGAILVLEAGDEAEAEAAVRSLPLVEKEMLDYRIYGARPYRGFVASLG